MNLLLDRDIPPWPGAAATKFINDLHKANPGAQWSIKTERMGCDKNGVYKDAMMWFCIETFKLNGVEVFELDRRCSNVRGTIKDLRKRETVQCE
jgi:hypothetical protein